MNEGLTGRTWLGITNTYGCTAVLQSGASLINSLWLKSCCSEDNTHASSWSFVKLLSEVSQTFLSDSWLNLTIVECELNVFTRSFNTFKCSSFELKSFTSPHKVWVRTGMKREHLLSVVRRSEVVRNNLNVSFIFECNCEQNSQIF